MPFLQSPYPLRFSGDDSLLLSPEALAMQIRVSCGFIRACFDAGCPHDLGRTSAAELFRWLCAHYEDVRITTGLRALASVDGLPPATVEKLRKANALATMLEYTRTRATDWRKKRQLREALEQVDRLTDHAG